MGCNNSTLSCCMRASQEKFSVECMDNPHPLNAVVVYGRDENPVQTHPPGTLLSQCRRGLQDPLCSALTEELKMSVQCIENPTGLGGVIIYGSETFPMPNQSPCEEGEEGDKRRILTMFSPKTFMNNTLMATMH